MNKKTKIGYFGSKESYTYLASLKRFGQGYQYIPEPTISRIFEDVIKNNIHLGVVPIENSTGGIVYDSVDELISDKVAEGKVLIEEELTLKIVLNLLSKSSICKIRKVYSHPFPVRFCREWVEKNLPGVQIVEVNNTSEAAKLVSKEKTSAAIASEESAKTYGLNIIARDIGSKEPNVTWFFVVSKSPLNSKNRKKKTAIAFSLKHRPGSLCDALKVLAKDNINLTRIISRPLRGTLGEYKFFIEIDGSIEKSDIKKPLVRLKKKTTWMHVISSYPTIELK